MFRRWLGPVAAGAILLLAGWSSASGEVAVPPLKAHVTDLTGTLSGSQIQTLESRLSDFERRNEVALLRGGGDLDVVAERSLGLGPAACASEKLFDLLHDRPRLASPRPVVCARELNEARAGNVPCQVATVLDG